jgi:hypothetical protein
VRPRLHQVNPARSARAMASSTPVTTAATRCTALRGVWYRLTCTLGSAVSGARMGWAPGDGLRGRLSSVPDQGQRLGCALRDHPRGGTDRDDLAVGESGHGERPSLPDSGPEDIPRPASPVPRPSSELAGLMMCGPRPPASMGRCAAEVKRRARQRRR